MRIAIVQDELVRKGGAEQVVLSFKSAFPDAPIYTLSYNSEKTYPEFKGANIITSWFGKFIKDDKNLKKLFFPFGVFAMKSLKIEGFDVVLQSTTHCAKYVKVDKDTLVLTYCHTPFRLVWRPNSYEEVAKAKGIKKVMFDFVIKVLRIIDKKSAERTDWFITNSTEVVPRIKEAYHPKNNVTVLHPSVKCANFYLSDEIKDYYLVVSRLEPYKVVDMVVEAFNQMPNRKLLVVGKGSMDKQLLSIAKPNITFIQGLDTKDLSRIYSECKALIFPQHEDYGITPLEANASGRPVIAYGKGGVLDTMIKYEGNANLATALFFYKQNTISLIEAITKFETLKFNSTYIRMHAEKFDDSIFIEEIRAFVEEKYNVAKQDLSVAL